MKKIFTLSLFLILINTAFAEQTTIDSTNYLGYLFDVAPVVAVMGVGCWAIYDLFKKERQNNKELQDYIRNSDKENLELLRDFGDLLNNVIHISNENRDRINQNTTAESNRISQVIVQEAKDLKTHIDQRIKDIEIKMGK